MHILDKLEIIAGQSISATYIHWFHTECPLCVLYIYIGNGQLVAALMDQDLEKQGYNKTVGHLLRQFLMEHGVIHKIDADNYLVPSAINPDPALPIDLKLGHYPYKDMEVPPLEGEGSVARSPYTSPSPKLSVVSTGLVYRRMLHLPPIASGFWSKLISLFIQHEELLLLLSAGGSSDHVMHVGTNRLRGMVSNVSVEWHYWKTGIMLIADDMLLMRVNSLRRDDFEDPQYQFIISNTLLKVQQFQYQESGKWVDIPDHLSEVIEIIVPVTFLADSKDKSLHWQTPSQGSVSAKLMAKALELVDEILKNHCEHLARNGIYTVNDMLHLVPCPLCYGDEDHRVQRSATVLEREPWQAGSSAHMNQHYFTARRQQVDRRPERALSKSVAVSKFVSIPQKLHTFRVDECIQQTLVSDCMSCPRHGQLEIALLAPDIVSLSLPMHKHFCVYVCTQKLLYMYMYVHCIYKI